jgi:hypothetical protein
MGMLTSIRPVECDISGLAPCIPNPQRLGSAPAQTMFSFEVSEWLEILVPLLALIIALVNLAYDKGNSKRKWLAPVLIMALFAAFLVQVRQSRTQREERNALLVILQNALEKQEQSPTAGPQKQKQSPGHITTLIAKQKEAANQTAATRGIPNQGWAYYGLQDRDGWTERYFRKESGKSDALPRVGDIVIAIGHVNAREGYIEYSGSDWVNKPLIGVIKPDDRLRVVDVYAVLDSYIWFKFVRVA